MIPTYLRRALSVAVTIVAIAAGLAGPALLASASTTTIPLFGAHPNSVVVDPVSQRAFALDPSSGRIDIIDTTTKTTVGTLPPTYGSTYGEAFLAVDPVLGTLYTVGEIASTASGSRYVITAQPEDGAGFSPKVMLGAGAKPTAIAVDPYSHTVFLTTSESSGPFQLNRLQKFVASDRSYEVPSLVPVTRLPNNVAVDSIAVDPLLKQVYLSNPAPGTVSIIDETTGAYRSADVRVGSTPHGLAVDTYTHEVFVADSGSGQVSVIDGLTRVATGTVIAVGASPEEIDVDHLTGRVFVRLGPGASVGSVAVVDGHTHVLDDPSLTLDQAREIAVDPLTHTLYAALLNSSAVAVFTE